MKVNPITEPLILGTDNLLTLPHVATMEDDESIVSTLTMESSFLRNPLIRSRDDSQQSEQSTRTVCFDETCNVEYRAPWDKEESQEQWYTFNELTRFQMETTTLIKRMHSDCETGLLRYREFRSRLIGPFNSCQKMDKKGAIDTLSSSQRDDLKSLYRSHPECVGLERLALSKLRKDKEARRHSLTTALTVMYDKLDSRHLSWNEKAEAIKVVCQRISLPCRSFAQEMAKAIEQETRAMDV